MMGIFHFASKAFTILAYMIYLINTAQFNHLDKKNKFTRHASIRKKKIVPKAFVSG